MQFSEHWLRQYCDPATDTEALSHLLTMAGLEVDAIAPVAPMFTGVVVACIISTEKHPDADRLQVCQVDIGAEMPLQIVCGASNARAGLKAPCAIVGAELPGLQIREAKVRGVISFGMMCSEKELGLAAESQGLMELPQDAAVGQSIRDYLLLDDMCFTLKLTPNRSDCLSVLGVAREVSALTDTPLMLPQIETIPATFTVNRRVSLLADGACGRYCGRHIRNLRAQAQTPAWMKRALERSGLRSISAIVDVTNYVMLELGQPLHAFDASQLHGDIEVRFAQPDESLVLLNDQVVKPHNDMLLIADDREPVALAGIMGGCKSAVSDQTTEIFLESAFFTPNAISGRARRLGISTDASYRFERGVDFAVTRIALERASALILEICGGEASEVLEVVGNLPTRTKSSLRMSRLKSVLGFDITSDQVLKLFDRIGFKPELENEIFSVIPPSYRFDISCEEDLIEEVARLHGYAHVPALLPVAEQAMLEVSEHSLPTQVLRQTLIEAAYQEVITYSFVDASWESDLLQNARPITLLNPIASNMSVMRSMIWGGLLDTLVYNLNRKQERVRIFEIGVVYLPKSAQTVDADVSDNGFEEVTRISGLAYGTTMPEQWGQVITALDFFDVKADVESLACDRMRFLPSEHPALHPGQTARILIDDVPIGWLGKLHPKWQQHYQLSGNTFLFELDLQPLIRLQLPKYQEIPKFPPLRRDLAIVVDDNINVNKILQTMREACLPHVIEISLFDVYRGAGVLSGKKSLAFLVLMQDTQRTLTDDEADTVMTNLLQLLEKLYQAKLRS